MSWSLKPHGIRTEPPHVLWSETFLPKLSDDDFRSAIRAANALADDLVMSVAQGRGASMIAEATLITGAVLKEMSRRGWDSTDDVGPSDAMSEGGVAGSAADKSRHPLNETSERTKP